MSRKRRSNNTTYALVFWTETNEISVLDARCVIDQSMLREPEKEGMVEFGEPSITAPPGGWPRFRARVLAVADNEVELRRMEDDFIENGTMSFNTKGQETNNNTTTTTATTPTTPTSKVIFNLKTKETEIRRKRQKPSGSSTSKSTPNSDGGYETRTKRNVSLDKQELLQRITVLESQLQEEKMKNEQLLRLNLQLQEGLPKLMEEALNKKSMAVTEIKKEVEKVVANKPIPEPTKAAAAVAATTTAAEAPPPPPSTATTTITTTITTSTNTPAASSKNSHPLTYTTPTYTTTPSNSNAITTTTTNNNGSISSNTNNSDPCITEPIQTVA